MKPTKSELEAKLAEWGKLRRKQLTIEADRDQALDPHVKKFEKATAVIQSQASAKLAGLKPQMDALVKEISTALLAGVDTQTGKIAIPQIVAPVAGKVTALAEVKGKDGARIIDPQKFFLYTPTAKRTDAFWNAVSIGVAKAEDFFGEEVLNSMATKATKYTVDVKLNQ